MELKACFCERCGASIVINVAEKKGICQYCGTEYLLNNEKPVIVTQAATTVIKYIYGNAYGSDNEKLFDNADKLINAGQSEKAKIVIDRLLCEETTDYRTWLLLIKYEMSFFDPKQPNKDFKTKIHQYIKMLKVYLKGNSIGDYLVFKSLSEQQVKGLTCCYIGESDLISLPDFGFEKIVKFCTSENFGSYDVDIGEGLFVIGKYAFSDCTNLKTVVIPPSIRQIDYKAFENCVNLLRIKFCFSGEVLSDENSTALRDLMWDKDKLGASALLAVIMRDVTKIETGLFANSKMITHISCRQGNVTLQHGELMIVFSNKLRDICSFAFFGCTNIKSVELPSSIERIDEKAFANCCSIAELEINSQNIVLGSSIFEGFVKTQRIKIGFFKKNKALWSKSWKQGCKAQIQQL